MYQDNAKICILLINDKPADVQNIEQHLSETMRLPWTLIQCPDIREATPHVGKADIIILDLALSPLVTPKEIFQDIEELAFETPIIVLRGEGPDEHDLATYVMEQGAADNMIRGKFGRLVDAIEFALIRQKITTGKREAREQILNNSKKKGEKDLKASQDGRAADQKKSRQILSLFSGGYSVDKEKNNT